MTDHDSWVQLHPNSPYEPIMHLFPGGIPTRDPFPMIQQRLDNGDVVSLWVIDLERLDDGQVDAIADCVGRNLNVDSQLIKDEAIVIGGYRLDGRWVASLELGPEGYTRTLEFRDFILDNPPGTRAAALAFQNFVQDQVERWVDGDAVPNPLPDSIDDVPEELRSPGLAEAIERNRFQKLLQQGNYSVLDMLSGRAMVEVLNQVDPEAGYEIARWDQDDSEDF